MLVPRLRSLWRNLRHRDRHERELDAEIAAMQDLLADDKVAAGLAPDVAKRLAAAELGGVSSLKEQVRQAWSGALLDALGKDLQFGFRLLRRNPLFTATACLSLAVGIGATTSVFTIANGLLLRPATGVADPAGVVDVIVSEPGDFGINELSYPDYLAIRRQATTLRHVFAYELQAHSASFKTADNTELAFINAVTPNFFEALGVRPAAGRVFGSADDGPPGQSPVVVLSHRFWTRRFNRDPAVVGLSVRINGQPMTIAGVAAADFNGITLLAADIWIPLPMMPLVEIDHAMSLTSNAGWLLLGGRLADGVSRRQASAQVTTLGAELERLRPATRSFVPPGSVEQPAGAFRWSVESASPIPYGVRIAAAGFLTLLGFVVSVVLAIACANIAGVLLTRATVRRREIAVRLAIGAWRGRLVRQLLTETVLLFSLGGAAGLLLARWMTTLLLKLLPAFPVPVNLALPLDERVVMFVIAVTFVGAVVAGLAPALHAARADLSGVLKDEGQITPARLRTRNAFVVAQVALSIVLVITAGLLTRALGRIADADHGFSTANVDMVSLDLALGGYSEDAGRSFSRDLVGRTAALPGVMAATAVDHPPGPGGFSHGFLAVPGYTPPEGQRYVFVNWTLTQPGYFSVLGVPFVAGRDLSATDDERAPRVAVISRSMAERYWPNRSAVGQTIHEYHASANGVVAPTPTPITVVGVVENLTFGSGNAARQDIYLPLTQKYSRQLTLLVKRQRGIDVLPAVRAVIAQLNPDLPVLIAQSLAAQQNGPVDTQFRIGAVVAASVGAIGVLLAAIGIYGVTAYAVARRTREIAIRLTLGAAQTRVAALVLRQGMSLVAVGAAIGLLSGAGVGAALSGSRFNAPVEPRVFVGAVAVFALVGLIACYLPVRRANRISPAEALRAE